MMALSGIIGMIPAFIIYHSWHIVIGLVYFGFVFYYMIQLRNNPLYFDDEKPQLALIIFVVGVITIFTRNMFYYNALNKTAVFFLFFLVFYLIRLNLLTEYKTATISISKNKNVTIIDCIMVALAICFVFFGINILTYIPNVVLGIFFVFFTCLKYIWLASVWLVTSIQNIYLFLTNYAQGGYEEVEYTGEKVLQWVETAEFFPDWETVLKNASTNQDPTTISAIFVGIFVFFAVGGIIYTIIVFHSKKKHNFGKVDVESEKSFIRSDFNLKTFIEDKFRKKFYSTSANTIRKAYAKEVSRLIDKGIEYEKFMTPNEYARIVYGENAMTDDFDTLTKKYNEVRYKENK